jgi:glycosyltransferase involved in cell wall biosynthesis
VSSAALRAPAPEVDGEASPAGRRVNVLLLASSMWIGGAEMVIAHLARTLDRRRFNVTVGYTKDRGQLGTEVASDGIEVIGLNDGNDPTSPRAQARRGKGSYLSFARLAWLAWRRRIDVVHTHTPDGLVDATLGARLKPGLKVVHTFHFGNYPNASPRDIRFERWAAPRAAQLVAVGEVQRGQIRSMYGFSDDEIRTLRNGVTLPTATTATGFRAQAGAADGAVLVGTIATMIEQKGLRDLLRTAQRIKQAGLPVRFVLVGEGRLRGELEALRRDLDVVDTVAFTGWMTHAADVALPAFDIFFQPSLWEAMSVVTLEAMAAGKPVVATRVGEAPHVIDDGIDGLLVDPQDVDGMTAALRRLVDDPQLRTRMGTAARRKVEQHFTVQHMTRAYEALYLGLLK